MDEEEEGEMVEDIMRLCSFENLSRVSKEIYVTKVSKKGGGISLDNYISLVMP